jgi:hypothetical protein
MKEKATTKKPKEMISNSDRPDHAGTTSDQHREALLDEALRESFPASDPPSSGRST